MSRSALVVALVAAGPGRVFFFGAGGRTEALAGDVKFGKCEVPEWATHVCVEGGGPWKPLPPPVGAPDAGVGSTGSGGAGRAGRGRAGAADGRPGLF